MGFSEAISTCYSKFLVFEGRASRSEFWYFRLFVVLANIVLTILVKLFPQSGAVVGPTPVIIMSIGTLLLLVPDISVQVRRFHDRGFSGFWLLPTYFIIPGVAIVALYVSYSKGASLGHTQVEAFILLGGLWSASFLFNFIVSVLPGHKGANKYGADPLEAIGSSITSKEPTTSIFKEQGYSQSLQAEHSSSKVATTNPQRFAEVNEYPSTARYESASIDEKEAAKIILQHDESVKSLFEKMEGVPDSVKERVLVEINKNPRQDIRDTKKRVILEALGRPDLHWDADLELLIQSCRNAPSNDVNEMFRVFPVLSMRMDITSIRNRFLTPSERVFSTTSATGRIVKITQREANIFEFDTFSGLIALSTLDEVYEYLGTPPAKRLSGKVGDIPSP